LFRLLGQTRAAVEVALGAVPQLVELVRQLNVLAMDARDFIAESRLTQQQAALLVAEVEFTRRQAQEVADNARRTEAGAAAAMLEVSDLVAEVRSLVGRFEPALRQLAPLTEFVANQVTVEHAEALTGLIETAPELVDKLNNGVLPVMDSLDTVGSDLREVLDTTQQMDEMLGAVPGLGRVKKRIEKQQPSSRRPTTASQRTDPLPD
jgi:ABC-type transporter Mla subunit MlaD